MINSELYFAYLKQTVREQGLPFRVTREVPNADTLAALKEYEEMKAHPENYKCYENFKEAMEDVLK